MAALTSPTGGDTTSSRDQKQYDGDVHTARQYSGTVGSHQPPADLIENAHSRPTLKFVYSAQV